jgi:hypothetical protein
MKGKLQTLGLQAQPCYESILKSLFDLLGKSLHLFCKDCDQILKCRIFGLVVCDRCKGQQWWWQRKRATRRRQNQWLLLWRLAQYTHKRAVEDVNEEVLSGLKHKLNS